MPDAALVGAAASASGAHCEPRSVDPAAAGSTLPRIPLPMSSACRETRAGAACATVYADLIWCNRRSAATAFADRTSPFTTMSGT